MRDGVLLPFFSISQQFKCNPTIGCSKSANSSKVQFLGRLVNPFEDGSANEMGRTLKFKPKR